MLSDKIYSPEDVRRLNNMSYILRHHVIESTHRAGSGHPGGCLSSAEIVATLYFKVLSHRPAEPKWEDRDRFILSKGHSAPVLYAALAECGYFPREELATLRKFGSILQGHTDMTTPGVDMSAGSLGQGLSFGSGVALAGRLDKKDYRVYVLLGDGECDEGQVWEAAMSAAHWKVDNLCAVIDCNKYQLNGPVRSPESIPYKFRSFGWHAIRVNGHDITQLLDAFQDAKNTKGQPTSIIADTIKGKGISFMENNNEWHSKVTDDKEHVRAMGELERKLHEGGIRFTDAFNWRFIQ